MKAKRTIGITPKVYVPAILQVVGGIAFLLLGLDVEGRTAIGTGITTLIAGWAAKPGTVEVA